MNYIYGYLTAKIFEGSIYYSYRVAKNMAYDAIFNNNQNNSVIITDPMWNKELQKKVFKKVIIDSNDDEIEYECVEDSKNEDLKKIEAKQKDVSTQTDDTHEIEIQTGPSLANFMID